MVFRLVLHASHVNHTKEIGPIIVSGCDDLMFHEGEINPLFESGFSLMIGDQNDSSTEAGQQFSSQHDEDVLVKENKPMEHDQNESFVLVFGNDAVIIPFQKQKLEQIAFVFVLNVGILLKVIGKHMVQIVLFIPPFTGNS